MRKAIIAVLTVLFIAPPAYSAMQPDNAVQPDVATFGTMSIEQCNPLGCQMYIDFPHQQKADVGPYVRAFEKTHKHVSFRINKTDEKSVLELAIHWRG